MYDFVIGHNRWSELTRINFFYHVMFYDELMFKNNSELNRHNYHYWSDVNPHWHRQVDNQHRWSVNIWYRIINGYLISLYFFDGNVNTENFNREMSIEKILWNFSFITITWRRWSPYTTENVDTTEQDDISLCGNNHGNLSGSGIQWQVDKRPIVRPPRFSDLTSSDFFLWEYIKNVVYECGLCAYN